jgi:hypothetical protein
MSKMSSTDAPPNATAGGVNVQVDIDDDSESEGGSTDSEDDFTSDGESNSDESSSPIPGQFNITNFLSTFTPFPKLPIQLRLKIWKYGYFFTRNVDIRGKDISGIVFKHACADPDAVAHFFHSYASPPSLLHVCRESRSEALNHYQLEFGTTFEYELAGVAHVLTTSTPQEFISIGPWIGSACSVLNHSYMMNYRFTPKKARGSKNSSISAAK